MQKKAASATAPSTEAQYNQAKFYFNQLQNKSTLSLKRANWLKGVQHFRSIYLSDPDHPLAPSSLYMIGRMHLHMFDRFQQNDDLDEAIKYLQDLVRLFPTHKLADDALYALGQLFLENKKDPQHAAHYFRRIVTEHVGGDLYTAAASKMKQLSMEHDIPLPKAMLGNAQFDKLNYVRPIQYWSSPNYTRIVIITSGPVTYHEELLEQTKDQPRRLLVDFQNAYVEPKHRAAVPVHNGLLHSIRLGQFKEDTVRAVLDIEHIDNYKIYSLPDPFRVVIDVRGLIEEEQRQQLSKSAPKPAPATIVTPPESEPKTVRAAPPPAPSKPPILSRELKKKIFAVKPQKNKEKASQPQLSATESNKQPDTPEKALSLAQQLGLGVRRIVLDPGHGGKDPGAMANGVKEKDIVLKIAKQLKPVLERELACEVILTRNDDRFLSLEERTAIANTQGADLFLSLHLNAHSSEKIRGFETYYLNLTSNADAMRVAALENATSTHQLSDLQDILADILKNSKIDESSRLARKVNDTVVKGLSDGQFGPVKNLGVKQAPFYVLIGAQMPAILIELAFISNKDDVKNLATEEFLATLAEHISKGIKSYVGSNTASL